MVNRSNIIKSIADIYEDNALKTTTISKLIREHQDLDRKTKLVTWFSEENIQSVQNKIYKWGLALKA